MPILLLYQKIYSNTIQVNIESNKKKNNRILIAEKNFNKFKKKKI